MKATIYALDTGATRCLVTGRAADIAAQLGPGEAWIAGHHPGKRINPRTRRPNKLLTMKPRLSKGRIVNLPAGATARFDAHPHEHPAEAGAIPLPDAFTVHLSHPLYAPLTLRLRDNPDALRRAAYPSHAEQLGALVKAMQALTAGKPVPAEALAVFAEVAAVKAAIRKD